jgi:3-hydroxybutyrate dehydrogenase
MAKGTALITGSTSGIGLGIAHKLADEGYNIIFNGLEEEGPEIAHQAELDYGVKTMFSPANMLKADELRQMVADGEKQCGPVDVLINNAGIQHVAPLEEFPEEKWEALIGINLSAAFHTSKAVWNGMKKRKMGRIIQIASAHGLVASPYKSAYVASKHGLIGLTKVLALEGVAFGITANAICPGYVDTPLVEKQIADQARSHHIHESEVIHTIMLGEQPIKEFIPIAAIADLVFYLCGPESRLITGASLSIDGGWISH